MISIIVAVTENGVIGSNTPEPHLLWRLPDDMKFFKAMTSDHPVIMGRVTYKSIPEKFRPLDSGRTTIVVTREIGLEYTGCIMARSLADALEQADMSPGHEEIFIAGGGEIYREALPIADRVYLTRVQATLEGEVTFPELGPEWAHVAGQAHSADARHEYAFCWDTYERR